MLSAVLHELPISAPVDGRQSPLTKIAGQGRQRWEQAGQPLLLGLGGAFDADHISALAAGVARNAPRFTVAR